MVPCLHQNKFYIKRKLWRRRAQKCQLWVDDGPWMSLKWLLWWETGRKEWSLSTFDLTPACSRHSCLSSLLSWWLANLCFSKVPTGSPAVLRRFLPQFNYSLEHTADISLLPSNDPLSTSFNLSFLLPRPPSKLLFSVRCAAMSVHLRARRVNTFGEWRNSCWMRARACARHNIPIQSLGLIRFQYGQLQKSAWWLFLNAQCTMHNSLYLCILSSTSHWAFTS